jgi:hypothetical protein
VFSNHIHMTVNSVHAHVGRPTAVGNGAAAIPDASGNAGPQRSGEFAIGALTNAGRQKPRTGLGPHPRPWILSH